MISVIIPILNDEELVEECLKKFLDQTSRDFELIVVDNGSSDKSKKISEDLKEDFKKQKIKLKVYYYPYGNQTQARAYGIKKAKGEIIATIDIDTFIEKNWIESIKKCLKDSKVVAIGGGCEYRNLGIISNIFKTINFKLRYFLGIYYFWGLNCAFKKEAYKDVKGFESFEGLKGLEEIRKKENIKSAKDDYYLSRKLERKGKIIYSPIVKATAIARANGKMSYFHIYGRIWRELRDNKKIAKYFKESVLVNVRSLK